MNKRMVGALVFAGLVALLTGVLFYEVYMSRQPQQSAAAPATTKIAVASKDLEVGAVIKEEDVKLEDYAGPVPEGATNRTQELLGRGVVTPIMAKEPVIERRLAPRGAGGGLTILIPPGLRAIPLRVNEVAGVAGFVVPGMHVDVLISGNAPGGNNSQGTVTRTLLQNVEVLSAGQDFKKDPEGKPIVVQVITVLATPEQAEILSLASAQTSIQLALRNPLDKAVAKTPGTTLAHLFTGGSGVAPNLPIERPAPRPEPVVAAAPPKKEPPFVMEIISGTTKKELKFENAGEAK